MPGPDDTTDWDAFFGLTPDAGAQVEGEGEPDFERMFSSDYLPGRETAPEPASEELAPPEPPSEEPAWYEDMPRKGAAVLEGMSLNALDNVLPDEYGGNYLRQAGHEYPTLRGLGTGLTGAAAAMTVPGAQSLGGSLAAQGILGAVAGGMGADRQAPEDVAKQAGIGAFEGASGGALGFMGGQILGKAAGALGPLASRVGQRVSGFVDDMMGGPANRLQGVPPPPQRYSGPMSPQDLESEWLARGRSIPTRDMPVVRSNDPYSQALQRTRDELTAAPPPPSGAPQLQQPAGPPTDPFAGRAGELARTPPEPMPPVPPAAPPDPFASGAAFKAPGPDIAQSLGMRDLRPGRGWRKGLGLDAAPPGPRPPVGEPPPTPPLETAAAPPGAPRPTWSPPPPRGPGLELDPSVPLTRRVREAPYMDPAFVEEARFGRGMQEQMLAQQNAPPAAQPPAPPPGPGLIERGVRTAADLAFPRVGRAIDRMAGGSMPPLPVNNAARAIGQYGTELGWESGTSRAHGQDVRADGDAPVAYAGPAALNYSLSAVLSSGDTGLSPDDERALTSAVVRGDDLAIRATDFRLRQRYPGYARRVEQELRQMNEVE